MLSKKTIIMLKSVIFLCLTVFFYFNSLTEVLQKYADGYTNIATSHETLENGLNPPFITFCMSPRAKMSILEKYNMSNAALNEPNAIERNMLTKLNKTIEELFLEATYQLNVDFHLYMIWWAYNQVEGWKQYKMKLLVGNQNYIKVSNI